MKYIHCPRWRFVYFVNQKVACSSIKEALLPLFPIDIERYSFVNPRGRTRLRPHKAFDESGFQLSKQEYLAREPELAGCLRFGFVRNPWDRLYSCYRQKIAMRQRSDRGTGAPLRGRPDAPDAFYLGMPFAEFVEQVCLTPDEEADVHIRSQSSVFYTEDPEPRCLASFVGRFEHLERDFDAALAQLNLDQRVALDHTLRSRKKDPRPYTDFYDDRLRALVARRFADDIRHFGYDFGA